MHFLFSVCNTNVVENVQPFFALHVYACVNTHVIKNSFGASVPVEELVEAGISIAGSH